MRKLSCKYFRLFTSADVDGYLQVRYQDGVQQRLHACAHDMVQLRDHVRSMLHLQLQTHTDGTISVQISGLQHRYRLAATLRWRGIVDQPGFSLRKTGYAFVIGMDGSKRSFLFHKMRLN